MKKYVFILFILHIVNADVQVRVQNPAQENVKCYNEDQFEIGHSVHVTVSETKNKEITNISYDYERYPGFGSYKYHSEATFWADARDNCKKEGSYLAIPNSKEEANLLTAIFNIYPKSPNATNPEVIHIGISDYVTHNKFISVLGEPFEKIGYQNWAPGEPEAGGRGRCVCMNRSAVLYDYYCTSTASYICEK